MLISSDPSDPYPNHARSAPSVQARKKKPTYRCASRTSGFWFFRAKMDERSAPTIPRACLIVLRLRFLATSSVTPFLFTRR